MQIEFKTKFFKKIRPSFSLGSTPANTGVEPKEKLKKP